MKTDIKEKKGNYLLTIDLPEYKKEEGKVVCKERHFDECQRSFYIGKDISKKK